MHVPFFSVVICTYQRGHLLDRAIRSLIAQADADWEAVVIDDGSTDDTAQVVQKYIDAGQPIRYFRHVHCGVARSRNAGILAGKGLFVTFLDSDDEYSPEHLSSRHAMLISNQEVRLLHGGIEVVGGDALVRDRHDPTQLIHLDDCVIGGTFVIRRDVFDQIGLFSEVDYGDDAEFFERAAAADISIARTDHPTYRYYRDTPDALTRTHGTT
ncbi:MAG TPA: glycosyl transferase [Bacteroidetes bacterium]|nr:glycosyl transferase [Bacteroidota bacterium]